MKASPLRIRQGYMSGAFVWVGLLIMIGAITVLSGIVSLARSLQRRRPDPAWKPAGRIQKYTGYDQEKAVASKRRALKLEQSSRKLAAERSKPGSERVRPAPDTNVVRIEKKRQNW